MNPEETDKIQKPLVFVNFPKRHFVGDCEGKPSWTNKACPPAMGPFSSGAVDRVCVHYGSQNANMNETDSAPEALWLLTSGCKTCASFALLECHSFCKVDPCCVVFDGNQPCVTVLLPILLSKIKICIN